MAMNFSIQKNYLIFPNITKGKIYHGLSHFNEPVFVEFLTTFTFKFASYTRIYSRSFLGIILVSIH